MKGEIAVIGAGICGLSTAYLLAQSGFKINIVASAFPPDTTSDKAAAFWFPYHIQNDERCIHWCRTSYNKYVSLMENTETGISMHQLLKVIKGNSEATHTAWQSFMPAGAYQAIAKADLKEGYKTGFTMQVPLIETHIFLPWLMENLKQSGVVFIQRDVKRLAGLTAAHDWVINCTGLGSRELCHDESIYPVRGQIAKTAPQQGFPIFLYEEQPFYIVPRRDGTLIGGTYEENVWEAVPEAETIARLYRQAAELYPVLKQAPLTGSWAGLRPYRPVIRVEHESGTNIIHNYGHGGSGFTLAWGCAADVVGMVTT
ncbi:FAD-dependent oxidoreductase [Pontibacter sp. MBLB2868]|uniref:FAD-dependent oxidoreductase n=1 Tax=Pontibacter sp. MBLB2868 TaxID=3451555 RepID=UPI003F74E9AE